MIEGARTNAVPNSTMAGVVGTAAPTKWDYTSQNGITVESAGTGTQDGLDYLDVHISGTSSGGSNLAIRWLRQADTPVVAPGQSWATSVYLALVAGSATGPTVFVMGTNEENSGGNYLRGPSVPISGLTAELQRFLSVGTLGADTAIIYSQIYLFVPNGNSIDMTLRIAAPQTEMGAFASSFIPTTTQAVTREADAATVTLGDWWSATAGTVCLEGRTGLGAGVLWQVDDGTEDERIRIERNGSDRIICSLTSGSVQQASIVAGSVGNDTAFHIGLSWKAERFVAALDGPQTAEANNITLPNVTTMRLGSSPTGESWNGTIANLAYREGFEGMATLKRVTNRAAPA